MSRTSVTMKPLAHEADMRQAARLLVPWVAWRAVVGAASKIAAWSARRRQVDRTVDALSQLSDHLLKDIGIHRSEIRSIARSGSDATHNRW